ncbi:MAG: glycosyltransferase family 9 protein [bacterium]|nr:glycosyltransferase family 9 protein [bacterium]
MNPSTIKNILIVRLGAIGDVVQTLPTLKQLQLNFPKANIYWAIEKKSYPILEHQKGVNFLIFPKEKIKNFNVFSVGWHAHKFRKKMQSIGFDLAVDLQGLFKSGWIIGNSGARRKVGFNPANTREGSHIFLNEWLPKINPKKMHRVDYYQRIITYLGGQLHKNEDPFSLDFTDLELSNVRNLMHRLRVKKPVVLNLGASKASKRWPAEYFSNLVTMIANKYPKKNILLTGSGKQDELWAQKILASVKPGICESAVSRTSLRELALIVKNSQALISCDSLALHLGSAFKVPSVGLFGGSSLTVTETGPYYTADSIGLYTPLLCFPCRKKVCAHHTCMNELSASRVYSELIRLIDNSSS